MHLFSTTGKTDYFEMFICSASPADGTQVNGNERTTESFRINLYQAWRGGGGVSPPHPASLFHRRAKRSEKGQEGEAFYSFLSLFQLRAHVQRRDRLQSMQKPPICRSPKGNGNTTPFMKRSWCLRRCLCPLCYLPSML